MLYAHIENVKRRNEGGEQPCKYADRKVFLPLKYSEEPHLSYVSLCVRPPADHPRDQSQSSMSLGSLLIPFYLIVPLII